MKVELPIADLSNQALLEETMRLTTDARCTTAKLIAGFQSNAVSSSFYPKKTDLWLGQAVKDVPLLPVRVLAQSQMGLMRVELVQATTVASAVP